MSNEQAYLSFEPGKSMSGDLPLDLRDGLTLMAGLFLIARDADGQQTIFLFEGEHREIAELFVERDGRIVFGAGNASVSIPPAEAKSYLGKWAVVLVSCIVEDEQIFLELEIDRVTRAADKQPHVGETKLTRWIQGGGKAEFGLRLVTIRKGVASDDVRQGMFEAIQRLWE